MPAKKIETVQDLIQHSRNANRGTKRGQDALEKSLKDRGAGRSVLADANGKLIAGNKTAKKWKGKVRVVETTGDELVVVQRTDLDLDVDDNARLLALDDNRIGQLDLDMDPEVIRGELADLDLSNLWTPDELEDLLGTPDAGTQVGPDADPRTERLDELQEKWQIEPGKLYKVGPHRIACGDATDAEDVGRLMAGGKASMIWTDPPYGVDYDPGQRKGRNQPSGEKVAGDDKKDDDLVALLKPAFALDVHYTGPEAAFYIWHASVSREDFTFAMKAVGLVERQQIIWVKNLAAMGRAHYQWAHEPCFYAAKTGQTAAFYGDRKQRTIWTAKWHTKATIAMALLQGMIVRTGSGQELYLAPKGPKSKNLRSLRLEPGQILEIETGGDSTTDAWHVSRETGTMHPTQKPVALSRKAIENSTQAGDIVLDTFSGVGGFAIAAHQTGRKAYALELKPRNVAVILERLTEIGLTPEIQ